MATADEVAERRRELLARDPVAAAAIQAKQAEAKRLEESIGRAVFAGTFKAGLALAFVLFCVTVIFALVVAAR